MVRFMVDNRGRIIFYGNPVGYVQQDRHAVVDEIFHGAELEEYLKQAGFTPLWEAGVFDRLAEGNTPVYEIARETKRCRLWQLKPDTDVRMRFIGYEQMVERFGEPEQRSYHAVYDGQLETEDLEEIYALFSAQPPEDYTGLVISISDVVEMYSGDKSEYYYCDRVGFKQITFSQRREI